MLMRLSEHALSGEATTLDEIRKLVGEADAGGVIRPLRMISPRLHALFPEWKSGDAVAAAPEDTPKLALQQRELQIIRLIAQGYGNRDVGKLLYIGEETVKWYLKMLYRKLGVANRVSAVECARKLGLLT